MKMDLKVLVDMQKIDDIIGEKTILTKKLPEELSSMKSALTQTGEKLTEVKTKLDENKKNQRLNELKINENNENIAKYKNQLLTIKTNKEYKALNSEVSHLEKINSEIDDDILDLMEQESNIKIELEKATEEHKKAEENLKANEKKLQNKITQVENEIKELREKRNSLAKHISSNLVRRYAALIKNKNRKAVVFSINNACSGCGYKIRPQLQIEVKEGNKHISCENCGRMLVKKPGDE